MSSKVKFNNYFSIELLAFLGNTAPSEKQINLIEDLIATACIKKELVINNVLSPREKTCLYLAALGKTAKETGIILRIRCSTVLTYRREIIRKLKCRNLTQAVYSGVRYGVIKLPDTISIADDFGTLDCDGSCIM